MGKIAIISIHGVGQQKPCFSSNFNNTILKSIQTNKEIKCFEFEWQHLVEPKEEELANNLSKLYWKLTRSFALTFIGDAVAYAKDSVFYKSCHKELDIKLKEISDWVGDGRIIIVAHSLGTIITYNFIYNLQNYEALGNKIFRAKNLSYLDKIDSVIFLGSPLYIYSLQRDSGGKPINLKNWINIYSPFDVIGYPIKKINDQFKNCNVKDISVLCGGLLTFWNPMSHIMYFSSKKVIKILCECVKNYE